MFYCYVSEMKDYRKKRNYFPLLLLLIGTLITSAIWYFDEASFNFRFIRREPVQFIITTLVVTLLPAAFFYFTSEKRKYRKNAVLISLSGFLPSAILLVFLMASNL